MKKNSEFKSALLRFESRPARDGVLGQMHTSEITF